MGEQLTFLLENEVSFWRSAGASLSQDWWSEDTRLNAPLRTRYSETYKILVALQKLSHPPSNPVRELLDVWSSFPALSKTSSGQIEQASSLAAQWAAGRNGRHHA